METVCFFVGPAVKRSTGQEKVQSKDTLFVVFMKSMCKSGSIQGMLSFLRMVMKRMQPKGRKKKLFGGCLHIRTNWHSSQVSAIHLAASFFAFVYLHSCTNEVYQRCMTYSITGTWPGRNFLGAGGRNFSKSRKMYTF